MSRPQQVTRPLVQTLRQATGSTTACSSRALAIRSFSSTSSRKDETKPPTTTTTTGAPAEPIPQALNPAAGQEKTPWAKSTIKQGNEEDLSRFLSEQLGSRRRRAALATTGSVPFEQLPYQCFQEARKILAQDREEKVAKILEAMASIKRLEKTDPSTNRGGKAYLEKRIKSFKDYIEELKILADINDPLVKRRFEDGNGDMSKPIYRYLARRKWQSMERKIIMQRIEQFHIVPDLLPKFEPSMAVKMTFRGYKANPGAILNSRYTETPPTLRMQVFDEGERLFSIVVLDADVPNAKTDSFEKRLHYMATNIPWDPTKELLPLTRLTGPNNNSTPSTTPDSSSSPTPPPSPSSSRSPTPGTLAVPWLPAFSQKGAPYHRLTLFVLQHTDNLPRDPTELQKLYDGQGREGFSLKSFRDKFDLDPVGFTMFRTVWDENTADLMARHNIPGAEVEFKPQRVYSLKPPRRARGWEARRQKPKFRHLWKYTKRIKGIKY
ncbi:phosphatidylethanolamine-binding protein [Dichotomopilus funicola]|uniref:Phosphatidylethanolamine-binding protein n=1 Tax=Dichotomopilus funicola TaxID=1934379 RepID=A0AAN6V2Q6_9PEZI|nr:phosphatidylethanolamine-binding protein [Dichotomopilus funicola]